ncbi:hypothetical protein BA011_08965 [Rhizobium leguminosarum]|uniref:Transposase DDE domain-containing protein n=1 Tax=Rhizobium leguminosarum TaxID=384 RepID=A0A1B1C7X2_RHILE|nr:hypothetical protein BA011_08965 [Rhizobium leguminosarum]
MHRAENLRNWLYDKGLPDSLRSHVTSLAPECWAAQPLYEELYCARGDMENRIKECQLDLYADRTSAHTMRANQLRLWFASLAYVLIGALRRLGLAHTRLADATCGTIRLKLLKIGAQVRVSVRRIKVAMASACPYAEEFALAHARIRGCGPMMPPDPNPPTNNREYITGPDKTPHIAATTARVLHVDATPAGSARNQ